MTHPMIVDELRFHAEMAPAHEEKYTSAEGSYGVVRPVNDLKSALVLSAAFAVPAAATVPVLLPSLSAEARSLPLPLPVFCAVLAAQMFILYGLLGFAGLRLARSRRLDP